MTSGTRGGGGRRHVPLLAATIAPILTSILSFLMSCAQQVPIE